MQAMQEDLVKSRMKMQDLEMKRQFEEAQKEKERMERWVIKFGVQQLLVVYEVVVH